MLRLSEIHWEATRLLSEISPLIKEPAQALLEKATEAGPLGGCQETFSPIYLYNHCRAGCPYCGFGSVDRRGRVILRAEEMRKEALAVRAMGCEAVYLLGGSLIGWSDLDESRLSQQAKIAQTGLLAVSQVGLFPILEMAPFSKSELAVLDQGVRLKHPNGGRFVLFQETYDQDLYRRLHSAATRRFKGEPEERFSQVELALEAGWPEIGVGALFGLSSDVWLEAAHVLAHALALRKLGARKVTLSVPRLKPISGRIFSARCFDDTFIKLVAVFSLIGRAKDGGIKVVITGRETKEIRDQLAPCTDVWGIRGSTIPGGYSVNKGKETVAQFELADRRSLSEIRADHARH